jgi:predicted transcriptional regulator
MDDGVVDRLRTLGMSLYEARIYLGLLRHGPQNGNEVSKSAGIPSSKVYSTLERLGAKGIVQSVRTSSGTQYVCISPRELVHRFRGEFEEPIDYLEQTLPALAAFEPASEVLTARSRSSTSLSGQKTSHTSPTSSPRPTSAASASSGCCTGRSSRPTSARGSSTVTRRSSPTGSVAECSRWSRIVRRR